MNRLRLVTGRRVSSSSCRIVSIMSGKGGVGKSVIAFNLADTLARLGCRVLLVDADQNSGDLHILANLQVEYGLNEYADGALSLREAVVTMANGVDLLAAGPASTTGTEATVAETARLMEQLRTDASQYDVVVIDHGSGINNRAAIMSHASDLAILVLVPELTSIADAFGLYKYLLAVNRRIECRLLVNRVQEEAEFEYIRDKFTVLAERFLSQAPGCLGFLPEDGDFRKAVASQVAISQLDTDNTTVVSAFERNAERLLQILAGHADFEAAGVIPTISKTPATADIRG